jgi:hypothetical protein
MWGLEGKEPSTVRSPGVAGQGGSTFRATRTSPILVLAVVAAVGAGCLGFGGDEADGPSWEFRDVTPDSGIEHRIGTELPQTGSSYATLVGSVAVADVDGDGWDDVFVGEAGPNELYRNQGDGTFVDVTDGSGIAGDQLTKMGLFLDHDDDGDQDLLLANHNDPSRLYRNDGNGTFTDVTEQAGVGNATRAYHVAAADVDGDDDLDVSVGNYGPKAAPGPESHANATSGDRDLLYVNQGNGTFREVGLERGLEATRWTFSHAWNDYDRDGDPDLYVNVDFGYDILYENDGTGNFTPVTREAGVVTNRNGMGARWVDVDGDRDLDLVVTNIHVPEDGGVSQFEGNNVWLNQGDGTFRDAASELGLAEGAWGWDHSWGDLDLDGDLDAVQANGMLSMDTPDGYYDSTPKLLDEEPAGRSPRYAQSQRYNESKWFVLEWEPWVQTPVRRPSLAAFQTDRVFLDDGEQYRDVAEQVGLGRATDSRAVPTADLDHDGDLDLIRTSFLNPVQVFENTRIDGSGTPGDAHWLQVELEGNASNRDAVGARLLAEAGDRRILRHVAAGGGFLGQSPSRVHLGLGTHETVESLEVTWPDGSTATFEDVAADQAVGITQPDELETGLWEGD